MQGDRIGGVRGRRFFSLRSRGHSGNKESDVQIQTEIAVTTVATTDIRTEGHTRGADGFLFRKVVVDQPLELLSVMCADRPATRLIEVPRSNDRERKPGLQPDARKGRPAMGGDSRSPADSKTHTSRPLCDSSPSRRPRISVTGFFGRPDAVNPAATATPGRTARFEGQSRPIMSNPCERIVRHAAILCPSLPQAPNEAHPWIQQKNTSRRLSPHRAAYSFAASSRDKMHHPTNLVVIDDRDTRLDRPFGRTVVMLTATVQVEDFLP